jgi:hypothetical protein
MLHGLGIAGPSPGPPPSRKSIKNLLGREHSGGVFKLGGSWDKNGLDNFLIKISSRVINRRESRSPSPGVWVLGLGLTVPLYPGGLGGGGAPPARGAGAAALPEPGQATGWWLRLAPQRSA